MALWDGAASLAAEGSDELARMLLRLRLWAVSYLNELADSAREAIAAGESLAVDFERVPGPGHPGTLTSWDNLASARKAVSGPDCIVPCAARDPSDEPIG